MCFAKNAFEPRKQEVRAYLDKAVEMTMRIETDTSQLGQKLYSAAYVYGLLKDEGMADWASGMLLAVWTLKHKRLGRAMDKEEHMIAAGTPLPGTIAITCDRLYKAHFYPGKRIVSLAVIALLWWWLMAVWYNRGEVSGFPKAS